MDPQRVPVLQSFKITTPSVTVTVTADDTPLPDGAPVLSGPGNLVTVSTPQKPVEGQTTTAASVPATPKGFGEETNGSGKLYRAAAPPRLELGALGGLSDAQPTGGEQIPAVSSRATLTELRRWNTYKGQQFEDTPFLGREVSLQVPIEAYGQGAYFKEMEEKRALRVYGPLPTQSYVVRPRYVRRSTGFWAKACECCG